MNIPKLCSRQQTQTNNVTNTASCPSSLGGCYVPDGDWSNDATFSVG